MRHSLSTPGDLIRLLQEIERRSRKRAQSLPARTENQNRWEGILFTIAGVPAVAPLDEVKEILNFPSTVTRVPGAKRWLLGIANIRGNLLPVIDLQMFFGSKPIIRGKRSRVLVIDIDGLRAGLLVGGVQGLQHFGEEQRVEAPALPDLPERIRDCARGAFERDGERRMVLSMKALAGIADFQVAAA
ncbi:MAG TPA: chemotaxis protein CheW [Sedimenticola sp.]|nr:chemotaxis protein CheW [Sedimenticola sp.]